MKPQTAALCLGCALLASGAAAQQGRPTVGVAFGGGSARGIAHIGVIQWFEEHHVPIDTAAGTSMGGLIGGAFASGMNAAELRAMVNGIDWDVMFGSSTFPFKNVRRKEDARSYPSRLEFGLKRGVAPPTSLNDGQQVDLFLARFAGPYYALQRFDDLPTPFRVVAVDLSTGEKVVIEGGELPSALRATMSLPAVFPPVRREGRVLVDGGALDNIPADVVKSAGANFVVAVDVGNVPPSTIDYSMFGLLGQTVDAMMRAATRAALTHADLTISVDVTGFGSLDWRRSDDLITRGYEAAERHRDDLLKYRLSDSEWAEWVAGRESRRKTAFPVPTFLKTSGFVPADDAYVRHILGVHLNTPLDLPAFERRLTELTGLDRYLSVTWRIVEEAGQTGVLVRAEEKVFAPPFLMLGLNVENTTSEDFRVRLAARYLAFDKLGSGSELRVDGAVGADPSIAAALYRPIYGSAWFVHGLAGANVKTFTAIQDGIAIGQYRERRLALGANLGVNLSRQSVLSGGLRVVHRDDEVRAGDPGLPALSGAEAGLQIQWVLDEQDSPVLPSRGTRALAVLSHTFTAPKIPDFARTNEGLTQAELSVSSFHSLSPRNRVFAVLSGGTSFGDHPLPTEQFTLGYPYVLDAFNVGERRGDHYAVLTLGGARQIARLPDFLGGPVFGSIWLENGTAFDSHVNADLNTHVGFGIVLDTLVGPVLVGASAGLDGGWRTLFGIGRIFR